MALVDRKIPKDLVAYIIKQLREMYDRWVLPTNLQIIMWELEELQKGEINDVTR